MTYATKKEQTRHTDNMLEQYQRQRPPTFKVRANDDTCMVEYQLEQTEKLLRHLQCDDLDKVNCATFMLKEEAKKWWQTMERALQRSHSRKGLESSQTQVVTQEAFKEVFNEKYFPQSWRQEKSWEFMNLKQTREMLVAQYDTRFTQLIKYVSMYEIDEWQMVQKFLSGLRVDLQQALSTWSIESYKEALNRALMTERNLL